MTTVRESFDPVDLLEAGQPYSRLDRFSRFEGRYEAMQNLLIEGECSGEIDCRGTLVIAEGATARANIFARDIRIAGNLEGEVECSGRFELLPTARASGSVRARQIIVQEGAEFDGDLQMSEDIAFAEPEEEPAPWEAAIEPAAGAESPPEAETRAFIVGGDAVADDDDEADDLEPAEEPLEDPEALPDFLRRRRD